MNPGVLKTVFRSRELRRKILVVLGLIALIRLLAHIPVPIPNSNVLASFLNQLFSSNQLLGFANLFSGGALANFSIIMMSVGPYINASIITQLMTQVIPRLEALQKEGEQGRQKINQYTRLLTLPLALIQSVGMIFLTRTTVKQAGGLDILGNPSLFQWFLMITAITGGTMLLMWIGEIISEKGIGNGISLVIFAGIIGRLPTAISNFASLASGDISKITTALIFVALAVAVVYAVVTLNEGQRNIPVSYARRVRGSKIYSGVDTHLPLRVITAGVIPIIFALAFLSIPAFLGGLFVGAKTHWLVTTGHDLQNWFNPNGWIYAAAYFVLVVGFTYFYTSVVFNSDTIAENLQKQGGFIPGIRPGRETASYLTRVINRITLAGAVSLGVIAILPFLVQGFTHTSSLSLGGTGLLIVVSVAIETIKQTESQAITASYEEY